MIRSWWKKILAHPYADSAVLLVLIALSVGSVRWWARPTVLLTVDGSRRTLHPAVKTVGEVLVAEQITLGPEDLCTPALPTALSRHTTIHVTRVTHKEETRVKKHKPRIHTRVQLKANLRPVLVEKGYAQEDKQIVRATFYDGVKTSERVLKRKTIKRPIFTLTLFNRKGRHPVKTYDLAKSKMLLMRATGYYVGERTVPSDVTFLGYKLRRGLVAVDPKVIPLRTRLYVKGYGYAYAADTGSAIKGNRIDLAVKDRKEEAQFNRKQIPVYILEKTKLW